MSKGKSQSFEKWSCTEIVIRETYGEISQLSDSLFETSRRVLDHLVRLFHHFFLLKRYESFYEFCQNETVRGVVFTAFLISQSSAPSATNLSSLLCWSSASLRYKLRSFVSLDIH